MFLCVVDRPFLVIFDFMFQLNAPFVYYIYQLPLHVSSNIVLIIRRIHCIHTASGSLYVTLLRWPLSAQAFRELVWCLHRGRLGNFFPRFRRNEAPPSSVTWVNLRTLQMFIVLFVCSCVRCLVYFVWITDVCFVPYSLRFIIILHQIPYVRPMRAHK